METTKKRRYARIIGLCDPIPIRNADVYTTKISADLVRSVRYWPKDTGLQIDMLSMQAGSFIVILSQIGNYFPEWISEIHSICSPICKLGFTTKKWYNDEMKFFHPTEVYELLPASEIVNFMPNDFKDAHNYSHVEFEMLPQSDAAEFNANYFRTRTVIPESRIIDTSELACKISEVPGTLMRTILRPVDDERASEIRTLAFNNEIHSNSTIDANASVVDIRCFLMANSQVSVGLKRLTTSMATDSALIRLSDNEIKDVLTNPLSSVVNFSRICVTAAALIRIPAMELAVYKEAKSAMKNIEDNIKLREELKLELRKDVMKEIETLITENNKQMLNIIHSHAHELLFSDILNVNDSIAETTLNKIDKIESDPKGIQWQ